MHTISSSRSQRRTAIFCSFVLAGLVLADPTSASADSHTWDVTSCDDSATAATTPGTLRYSIANAATDDDIDLSKLMCSTITLGGSITIPQNDLQIFGAASNSQTITVAYSRQGARIFDHEGTGYLSISYLNLSDGYFAPSSGSALGGCIFSRGGVEIYNSTVSNCSAVSKGSDVAAGGAISAQSVNIVYSTVTGNVVDNFSTGRARGGAIYAKSTVIVDNSSVSNNTTYSLHHLDAGGAIYSNGIAAIFEIRSSLLANNNSYRAALWVGGNGSTATLLNSTISGNKSVGTAGLISYEPLAIYNSTIASNTSTGNVAAGISAYSNIKLQSSLIAENIAQQNTIGPFDIQVAAGHTLSGDHNLITGSNGLIPFDTITKCPLLGPLADNGGFTFTQAIAHNSPAIDAGDNEGSLGDDQRGVGFPRLFGASVDVGAFEWQGTPDDRIFKGQFENRCQ